MGITPQWRALCPISFNISRFYRAFPQRDGKYYICGPDHNGAHDNAEESGSKP